MCGILGSTNTNDALSISLDTLKKRGPDASSLWSDERVSLGHARLSIIDLDSRANQPMWNDDRTVVIVFNGEIYNFKQLREELSTDYVFKTESDTEVLISGYLKYGPSFVERLEGMFAYAIYDIPKGMLYLFRDTAGVKPLLYHLDHGMLLFASEMKAITTALGARGTELELDRESADLYLTFGYVPSPRTLYKQIRKIPRGSYLTYSFASRLTEIQPFTPKVRDIDTETSLGEEINKSIVSSTLADVPVGIFFSGGTDSSILAAVLNANDLHLETFSIRIHGRPADSEYFTRTSTALGIRAHVYDFTQEEFEESYLSVLDAIDEPLADNSLFPTYFVARKAAEKVKVVLSGEGGDENFFGYERQRTMRKMRNHTDGGMTILDYIFITFPHIKGKRFLFSRLFSWARQPFSYYLLTMALDAAISTTSSWARAKSLLATQAADPLYIDRDLYLESDLLHKTDVATSMNSIEGRVPLLGQSLITNAPAFEDAYLSSEEMKPVLKRFLTRYLTSDLVYRKKTGFGLHLPDFLEKSLAFLEDQKEARSYLKKHGVSTHSRVAQPSYELGLVILARTIMNNRRSWETGRAFSTGAAKAPPQ